MKHFLLAVLLTLPLNANAMPTEQEYCLEVATIIMEAVEDGLLDGNDRDVLRMINRCEQVKWND